MPQQDYSYLQSPANRAKRVAAIKAAFARKRREKAAAEKAAKANGTSNVTSIIPLDVIPAREVTVARKQYKRRTPDEKVALARELLETLRAIFSS